jgi:hypothetical protein
MPPTWWALAVWCTALGVRPDGCSRHWGSIPPPTDFGVILDRRAMPLRKTPKPKIKPPKPDVVEIQDPDYTAGDFELDLRKVTERQEHPPSPRDRGSSRR